MPKQFEPRPWEDTDAVALIEHLNSRGFKRVGRDVLHDVILLEARTNAFHPVRDYLDALHMGRRESARPLPDRLLRRRGRRRNAEAEQGQHQSYVSAVTRCFFISGVARIFQPGCKVDSTLILEGVQGALKSSLLRALAVRDEWFSDSLPHDLASKDARQHLAGVWIVELSEIAQFRRSEIESVKDYLSCQIDRYRPPYGRSDVAVPRQNIFIGSTNADVYLHDYHRQPAFLAGPDHHDQASRGAKDRRPALGRSRRTPGATRKNGGCPTQVEKIAAEQQDGRLERDPWFDKVASFVNSRLPDEWITTASVLDLIDVKEDRRDRGHEMRVGAMLRQLGCKRKKRRDDTTGKPRWSYRTPPATDGFRRRFRSRKFVSLCSHCSY